MKATFLMILPLILAAQTPQPARPGRVEGTVVDDAGRPVPSAFVAIHVRPTGPGATFYDTHTTATAAGAFAFPTVPPGRYEVCAQSPGSDLLPTCIWPVNRDLINVAAGQTVRAGIVMRAGHRLRVRLDDAQGLLASRDNERAPRILVGVSPSSIGLLLLQPTLQEARVREYGALVPFDSDLNLTVQSGYFRVGDDKSTPLDVARGHRQALRVARAQPSAAPVRLTVLGLQPGVP